MKRNEEMSRRWFDDFVTFFCFFKEFRFSRDYKEENFVNEWPFRETRTRHFKPEESEWKTTTQGVVTDWRLQRDRHHHHRRFLHCISSRLWDGRLFMQMLANFEPWAFWQIWMVKEIQKRAFCLSSASLLQIVAFGDVKRVYIILSCMLACCIAAAESQTWFVVLRIRYSRRWWPWWPIRTRPSSYTYRYECVYVCV